MVTDTELLSAWRGGDLECGRTLFERHFDGVRRFFANKLDHGAEDMVQRTFLACVEGRDRFCSAPAAPCVFCPKAWLATADS